MKRALIFKLLIGFLPLQLIAQDCDTSMFFMDAVKNTFQFTDTIIVSLSPQEIKGDINFPKTADCFNLEIMEGYYQQTQKELTITRNPNLSDSLLEFQVQKDWKYHQQYGVPSYPRYTYYKSADGWYTCTYLHSGKYAPVLHLVNYTPSGQFNTGVLLAYAAVDAGSYDVGNSAWRNDTLYVSHVGKGENYYKEEDRWTTITDSTVLAFYMEPSGELQFINSKNHHFEK